MKRGEGKTAISDEITVEGSNEKMTSGGRHGRSDKLVSYAHNCREEFTPEGEVPRTWVHKQQEGQRGQEV